MNLFFIENWQKNIGLVFASAAPLALDCVNRIHFTENARASLDLESTNNRDGFIKSFNS
jgi:hypothetical protein